MNRGSTSGSPVRQGLQSARPLMVAASAGAVVCAASVAALALEPWLGRHFFYVLYLLAIVSITWIGGRQAGLIATFLAVAAGVFVFIYPRLGFALPPAEIARVIIFTCLGIGVSFMVARHRDAEREVADKERQLRRANSRLNEVLESTTDCVQLIDRDWRIVYMNSRALEHVPNGERLLGSSLWEAFPGLEGSVFGKEYRRAMRDSAPVRATDFYAPFNAWLEVHAYPSETGLTVYFRDVTDRIRSEERFQSILESISDPFVGLDAEFRYQYVNSAAERHLGRSGADLLGKVIFNEFAGTAGTVLERNLRTAAEQRIPLSFENYYAPWDRWYEMRVSPAPAGGVSIFFRDITERKQSEIALAESEKRFRSTFENAAVGIAHVGNDGQWLRVNARLCEIVGYSRSELLSKTFQDITHSGDVQTDEQLFARLKADEISSYAMEKRYVHRDGHTIWVLLTTAIERAANGAPLYSISVIQDITERRNAEQALQSMNEDLKRFAYAASHDLQEPLRMVVSFTELLKRKYGDSLDRNALQIMDYAVSGARRMEESLRGLRAYWIASEQMLDPNDSVDAEAALDQALANLESAISETGARIGAASPLPRVSGDMAGMVQVFQNLVGNAIKYQRDGVRPQVRITAEPAGAQWLFRVVDNGIGVPREYRSQVFGLFKRLHARDRAGTGIGLALCQRIIERRGGAIWVEAADENGSAFCFTLPAAEAGRAIAS